MSHFSVAILTDYCPEYADISTILEPYDENREMEEGYNPNAKWDWWTIGGRWSDVFGTEPIKKQDFPKFELEGKTEEELIAMYPNEYDEWKQLVSGETKSIYESAYFRERYATFLSYLAGQSKTTWAVITEDGNWHEPGEIGWFGYSDATPESENEWAIHFYRDWIEPLPEQSWVTVVDCHI